MKRTLAVLAVSLALAGTGLAGPSIVLNGSFEAGTDPGDYLLVTSGATDIDGWDVSASTIAYVGTRIAASDGDRSINLRNAGIVSQDLATVIGRTYLVTFDMAGYPRDPYLKMMEVWAGASQFAEFSFDATNATWTEPGWVSVRWQFIAEDSTTTLSFASPMHEWTNTNRGALIDNVSVVPTAPAPGAVILASLGAGLTGWLRRRRAL